MGNCDKYSVLWNIYVEPSKSRTYSVRDLLGSVYLIHIVDFFKRKLPPAQ